MYKGNCCCCGNMLVFPTNTCHHSGAPNENIKDSNVKRILVFKR